MAAPVLYRNLTLKFWDMRSLQSAVSEITESPQGRHFLKYARRLYIVCLTKASGIGAEEAFQWKLEPWAASLITDDDPARRNGFLEYWLTSCPPHPSMNIVVNNRGHLHWRDRSWAPVEFLIACLDRLDQIEFIAGNEFTSGLRQAVSQNHPNCRVDISWQQAVGYSVLDTAARKQFHPYQIASDYEFDFDVLRLPGLHALPVKTICGTGDEELDEMLPFVLAAPGLKHFGLQGRMEDRRAFPLLKEKWQALTNVCPPKQKSKLESLTLSGAGPREENLIFKLAAAGDLSNLRTLVLGQVYNPENVGKFAGLFPNLERLFINPNPTGRPWIHLKTDHGDSIAGIRAFRPLKYLCLHNLRSVENLHRIIEQHGQSLKGLIIEPSGLAHFEYPRLDVSDIVQLATDCPNLEELRVQIKRSMGSQTECELYKSLGKFPKLHSLVLDLHFDPRAEAIQRPHVDTDDLNLLREVFMNAATDERLALGIWNLIKTNKSSRLQYLRIVPFGNHHFGPQESCLLDRLARSFLVTRYNFQDPMSPSIEEIGRRAREIQQEQQKSVIWSDEDQESHLSERLAQLVHSIWPQLSKGGDWRSDWTSFPLEADNT